MNMRKIVSFFNVFVAVSVAIIAFQPAAFAAASLPTPTAPSDLNVPQSTYYNVMVLARSLGRVATMPEVEKAFGGLKDSGELTPQEVASSANKLNLHVMSRSLSWKSIVEQGGPAIVHLRNPSQFLALATIGNKYSILSGQEHGLVENDWLKARFVGDVIVPQSLRENPEIQVDEPISVQHIAEVGKKISARVSITNKSKSSLSLEVAEVSCGCTSVELSAHEISPSNYAIVTIQMQTSGWVDKMETVTLRTNNSSRPQIVLSIQAQMPRKTFPLPAQIQFDAAQGESAERVFSLILPKGATIADTKVLSRRVEVRRGTTNPLEGEGVEQKIVVSLLPSEAVGTFQDRISFVLKNAETPDLSVPIRITINPDITCLPKEMFLGRVSSGASFTKIVIVRSSTKRKFSILDVKVEGISADSQYGNGIESDAHAIQIQGIAAGHPGTVVEATVTVSLSNGVTLKLPISGMISVNDPISSKQAKIQVAQLAPDFSVLDMNGIRRSLSDLKGRKNLILTFFPKCFTGGCTNHLSSIRDVYPALQDGNTEVWAVSVDSAEGEDGQKAFARMWNFKFSIIPDVNRKLCLLYGAVEQPTELARRLTVVIDKQGYVRYVDNNIKVQTHGADMLAKIKELGLDH